MFILEQDERPPSDFRLDMTDITTNIPFTVSGSVSSPDGLSLPDEPITLQVIDSSSSTTYKSTTNSVNGEFSFTIPPLPQGNYNISVSYPGSDVFDVVNGTVSVAAIMRNTTFTNVHIYPPSVGVNSNLTIIADLIASPTNDPTGSPSEPIDGDITVVIGSQNVGHVASQGGHVVFNLVPGSNGLSFGVYDIILQFPGNVSSASTQAIASKVLTIVKSNVDISLNQPDTVRYLDTSEITGTVVSDGVPLATAINVQSSDGVVKSIVSDKKGNFSFKYMPNNVGNNVLIFSFDGNESYSNASTSLSLNVLPASMSFILGKYAQSVKVNQKIQIQGSLVETVSKKGIQSDNIDIMMHGPDGTDSATVSSGANGGFSFGLTLLSAGEYTITLNSPASGIHDAVNIDFTILAA